MIRASDKAQIHSRLSNDRFHDTQRPSQRFQHRSLLDMKLEKSERIWLQLGARNFPWIQPKILDGRSNRNSIRIGSVQKLLIQPAHQRAAANERRAEPNTFFFRKANDFDPEGQPSAPESLDQCHR